MRDEAHRFAIEFHRGRRDKAMTRSVLDDLPGVGPARKRLLLNHFGTPERFLAASREELEAVPGLPGKVARDIHAYVTRRVAPARPSARNVAWAMASSTRPDKGRRTQRGLSRLRRARSRGDAPARSIEDFVVITGFSGAGKSQAMACFEDAGYFCVDNLPPEMIGALAELFAHEGSKVERAAVVCDVRGGEYFERAASRCSTSSTSAASRTGCCSSRRPRRCSIDRYKETRRRHPLARAAARSARRSARSASCSRRCASAPTSRSTPPTCRRRGCARWWPTRCCRAASVGKLAVTFLTYGFKHGAPRDADLTSTSASCRTRTTRPSCAP